MRASCARTSARGQLTHSSRVRTVRVRAARRRDATPVRSGVRSARDYPGTFVPPPGGTQCPSPRHATEARVLARSKPGRARPHRARLPALAADGDRPGPAALLADHDHQRRQGSRARRVAGRDLAGQRRLQRHQHGHVRRAHGGRGRLRHRRSDPGHLVAGRLRQGRPVSGRRTADGHRRGHRAVPRSSRRSSASIVGSTSSCTPTADAECLAVPAVTFPSVPDPDRRVHRDTDVAATRRSTSASTRAARPRRAARPSPATAGASAVPAPS